MKAIPCCSGHCFDVGGLKYVFQIDQGPDVRSEDAAVVADHESVLNLAQLGDGIKKVLSEQGVEEI